MKPELALGLLILVGNLTLYNATLFTTRGFGIGLWVGGCTFYLATEGAQFVIDWYRSRRGEP